MAFRKIDPLPSRQDEFLPVIAQPVDGHSDEDVFEHLRSAGATSIEHLAPGFISADLPASAFASLESIALVRSKSPKQMRRPLPG